MPHGRLPHSPPKPPTTHSALRPKPSPKMKTHLVVFTLRSLAAAAHAAAINGTNACAWGANVV